MLLRLKSHLLKRDFCKWSLSAEYAVDSKGQIQGQIEWTNNLDTKINDVTIVAKFLEMRSIARR